MLYLAMEDFRVDVVVGKGPGATAIPLEIPRFTLAPGQDLQYFSMPTRGIHEFDIDFDPQDRPEEATP